MAAAEDRPVVKTLAILTPPHIWQLLHGGCEFQIVCFWKDRKSVKCTPWIMT